MTDGPDPRIGAVLDNRYRVVDLIASGGMGSVYRGERVHLGRPVAIKFLHAWGAREADVLERFSREARAMSRLAHPSCVAVIDFGVHEGVPFLIMEYATGRTLRTILREDGALPAPRALAIARQILAGLAHAHEREIVHRDVKPDNIVLSEVTGLGFQARLLDFGLAKVHDVQPGLSVGFAIGTPSYMAPEQTYGEAVNATTDVYAMGAVLFEMLTGKKLFDAESAADILRLQREATPPRLRDVAPRLGLSGALEAVLARALAKPRRGRFQSAAELAAALEATPEAKGTPAGGVAAGRPATVRRSSSTLRTRAARRKRRSRLRLMAVAVAILALGTGAWFVLGRGARRAGHAVAAPAPHVAAGGRSGRAASPDTAPKR